MSRLRSYLLVAVVCTAAGLGFLLLLSVGVDLRCAQMRAEAPQAAAVRCDGAR